MLSEHCELVLVGVQQDLYVDIPTSQSIVDNAANDLAPRVASFLIDDSNYHNARKFCIVEVQLLLEPDVQAPKLLPEAVTKDCVHCSCLHEVNHLLLSPTLRHQRGTVPKRIQIKLLEVFGLHLERFTPVSIRICILTFILEERDDSESVVCFWHKVSYDALVGSSQVYFPELLRVVHLHSDAILKLIEQLLLHRRGDHGWVVPSHLDAVGSHRYVGELPLEHRILIKFFNFFLFDLLFLLLLLLLLAQPSTLAGSYLPSLPHLTLVVPLVLAGLRLIVRYVSHTHVVCVRVRSG